MAKRPPSVPPRRSQPRPKRDDRSEAGAIINEIYQPDGDEQGDQPLKKIEQSSPRRIPKRLLTTLGIIAVLVGATIAGFLTFNRKDQFNDKGVSLTFETPETVVSAGDSTITLTVHNGSTVGIQDVELSVSAPNGWTFKRSEPDPSDPNNTLWQVGTIPANGKRSVTIVGALTGEVGSVETFNGTVTYRPTNFNYTFTSRASGSVTIGSSIVELTLNGPAQASPTAETQYVLSYTNTSSEAISDLRLVATFPDGFTVSSTSPKPREGNSVWVVDTVKSKGTGTITFSGTFSGEPGDSKQITFDAELRRGSAFERQVETSLIVLLVSSTLDLHLTASTPSGPVTVARAGDALTFEFSYANGSDLEMKDAVVTAKISGGAFDPASFSDDYGSALKDGTVVWDVSHVPDLASIKPGTSGTIRFSLKVPDVPAATKDAGGPTIDIEASMTADDDSNETNKSVTVAAAPLSLKVVSRVTLNVEPRYYGDQGEVYGSGPLPPSVGKTTVYRVSWFVGNTTNELKNMSVTADVPSTVFWTGKQVTASAGDFNFDSASRKVTWTLNRLPAGVGQTNSTISATFEVAVTPAATDVGSVMTLLEPTVLAATDSFTGTKVDVTKDKVTTDLPNDPQAAGKGIVVQ